MHKAKKTSSKKIIQPAPAHCPTDPSLRTIAMPADTNPNGDMFGGWMLSMMDLAGANKAMDTTGLRVVTIAVDAMTFHRPAFVGDEISCFCTIEKIGNTSIRVLVEAWARSRTSKVTYKITQGIFTYVAIGKNRKPVKVKKR